MKRSAGSLACLGIAVFSFAFPVFCSAAANDKSVFLCDFEVLPDPNLESAEFDIQAAMNVKNLQYPDNDFMWHTAGYARMSPVTREQARRAKDKELFLFLHGKAGARIRFSVPGDYVPRSRENQPAVWETGLTLSIDSQTPLEVTDWAKFKTFSVDVYNKEEVDHDLQIRFTDSNSREYVVSATAAKGKQGTIQVPMADLEAKRLNIRDIKLVTLFMDTAKVKEDPFLIFDNVQLNYEPLTELKLTAEMEEEAGWEELEEEEAAEEEEGVQVFGGRLAPVPVQVK